VKQRRPSYFRPASEDYDDANAKEPSSFSSYWDWNLVVDRSPDFSVGMETHPDRYWNSSEEEAEEGAMTSKSSATWRR